MPISRQTEVHCYSGKKTKAADHDSTVCLASMTTRLVLGIFQQEHLRIRRAVLLQF